MNSENIKTCDVCYKEIIEDKKEKIDGICEIHINNFCMNCIMDIIKVENKKFICPLCRKNGIINTEQLYTSIRKIQNKILENYFDYLQIDEHIFIVFEDEEEIYEILKNKIDIEIDETIFLTDRFLKVEILNKLIKYIFMEYLKKDISNFEELTFGIMILRKFLVKKLLLENDKMINYIIEKLEYNQLIKSVKLKINYNIENYNLMINYNKFKMNFNKLIN